MCSTSYLLKPAAFFLLLVPFAYAYGCGDSSDNIITDSGTKDSGTTDSATNDSGTTDSETPETGLTDGGLTDSGTTDASVNDASISTIPTVISNFPLNGATGVPLSATLGVTFSEAMDPATFTTSTFILTADGTSAPVLGKVSYANSTALFWPNNLLASNAKFAGKITTSAWSSSGVALAANHVWSFTTGAIVVQTLPVNLGTAGSFVMLAKTGISTVPISAVTGNIGISPAAATFITGFSLTADSTNVFSTSPQVTGRVYAANYAPPTPSNMTSAIGDMGLAFTDAAGRAPNVTELGAGKIGGMVLAPGVYKWGSGVQIPTNMTLSGSATDVWIFQIAQGLTLSSGTKVLLSGGALPKNIFWQVSGKVEVGTGAHLEGVVLGQTSIALRTGASIKGRLLAQTALTIDGSTVLEPSP